MAILFMAILVVSVVTGTVARDDFPHLMQRLGWDLPEMQKLHFYKPWAGLIFSSLPGVRPTTLAVLLLGVGSLEYFQGTKTAVISFFTLGVLTSFLSILILWPFDRFNISWVKTFLYTPDMGSSSASLVCWGLTASKTKSPWRGIFITGTFLTLFLLFVIQREAYSVDHLVAFTLGILTGMVLLVLSAKSGSKG